MKYVKVERAKAEKARRLLVNSMLFDSSAKVKHSRSYVFFPITITHAKDIKLIGKLGALVNVGKGGGTAGKGAETIEQELSRRIGKGQLERLSKGYDRLGNIAIIEFTGSRKSGKIIAEAIMKRNKGIETVLLKAGAVSGKYRIRKLEYVSGKKDYIAEYRENGCIFRFDVRKAYFSNRLSFERSRILDLVKGRENVMVMFSGVGPFAIEIAKRHGDSNVVAIELNRYAHRYALENIKTNRTPNVKAVLGDVRKKAGDYRAFADRIIMPLPMSSLDFLDSAYKIAKEKAVVHLYAFTKIGSDEIIEKLRSHAKANGYRIRILNTRTARPYSSTEIEIAVDYSIKK